MTDVLADTATPVAARQVDLRRQGSRAVGLGRRFRRIAWYFDDSETSRSAGARRIRRVFGLLFLTYATALEGIAVAHGTVSTAPLFIVIGAATILLDRFGRFAYYFLPVSLGVFAYGAAAQYASQFKLGIHYLPQLRVEQYLTPGPIPTVWLQDHLYHGVTGPLEVFCVAMYASHFLVPLMLGLALALSDRGRAFGLLMFGILAASILGEITFILAPTAPPWLAAQAGHVHDVHHILRRSLYDLHMTQLADLVGDKKKYDVTAAVPSLHVAFPVICVLTALQSRLPRWVVTGLVLNLLGVVFAIVYMGEHYVVDAIAGLVYGLVAWSLVRRILGAEPRGEAGATPVSVATAPMS
jgi:hypothetical protein